MTTTRGIIPLLLLTAVCSAWAAQPDRVTNAIDNGQTVVLKGSVHPLAQPGQDRGALDPSTELPYVSLLIQPSADQQAALNQLLAEQQDPFSPNYHKWLTPEQFGERFGLSDGDLSAITGWLRSKGFSIAEIARGRDWIAISGTVAQIQRTFHTQIHRFNVEGEERFANATELSVPKALKGIVVAIHGLNNFKMKPMIVRKRSAASPDYSLGVGNYFLAPDDIATIYDIGPLYTAGIDGTGMKIAVMGQTDVHMTDIEQFRAGFNLSTKDPTQVLATGCSDPGFNGDEVEADLDLEWSGAVARNANIIFVKCDTTTGGGVIGALQYAINNNIAPVLSMSYDTCEANFLSALTWYETLIQQANTQGQTLMVSSGDSGAATCDKSSSSQAIKGLAVNALASPPEVTAVGGTEFNEGIGNYWNPNNGPNGGSAISYIPELAWDDSAAGTGLSSELLSTGGGASIFFKRPSFQTGPGTFDTTYRSVPDVSMPASSEHDGYILCTNVGSGSTYVGSCANGIASAIMNYGSIVGGTSVACPVFAGVVALLNQSLKNTPPAGLGNINPVLYQLAQKVPTAFHDVPAGNYNFAGASANPSGNVVPCTPGTPACPTQAPFQLGFLTGPGYDEVTGLGSVDAKIFVTNWASVALRPTTTTLSLNPTSVILGSSGPVVMTATVAPAAGTGSPTGSVNFFVNGGTAVGSGILTGGTATFNYNPNTLAVGTYSITAQYGGDTTFANSTSSNQQLTVQGTAAPTTTTLTLAPTSVTVGSSGPVVMTATVKPATGTGTPTGSVNFFKGGTAVGGGALSGGTATFNYNPSTLAQGTYSITAQYGGDTTFAASTSSIQQLTVQQTIGFVQVPGGFNQITVGDQGSIWGLNSAGQIYTYNATTQTWVPIGGILTQIAAAPDGSVWGINSAHQVFSYNTQTQGWNLVPGALLTQIAVGSASMVWGINATQQVFRYNPGTQGFDLIPGALAQIAVAPDGSVWGLNAAQQIFTFNLYTQSWNQVPGSLLQIAVGSANAVWGLTAQHVYHFNPQTQGWDQIPGGALTRITVAANGAVWGLNAASQILTYDPQSQNWDQIPGTLSQLAVGDDGSVWGVNAAQQIFKLNVPPSLVRTWERVSGQLAQVAVGGDGAVWGINAAQNIYTFNSRTQSWNQVPGSLIQIAVGFGGTAWGINAAHNIYAFNPQTQSWRLIPGSLTQIAMGADGAVWGINAAQNIYAFNAQSQSWQQVPGSLTQIAVGSAHAVWGINAQQQIYQYNPQTQGWDRMPGLLTQIGVALDGTVWGINSAQEIYTFDRQTQGWDRMAGSLNQIAVGCDGVVWGLNSAQQIYRLQ